MQCLPPSDSIPATQPLTSSSASQSLPATSSHDVHGRCVRASRAWQCVVQFIELCFAR